MEMLVSRAVMSHRHISPAAEWRLAAGVLTAGDSGSVATHCSDRPLSTDQTIQTCDLCLIMFGMENWNVKYLMKASTSICREASQAIVCAFSKNYVLYIFWTLSNIVYMYATDFIMCIHPCLLQTRRRYLIRQGPALWYSEHGQGRG